MLSVEKAESMVLRLKDVLGEFGLKRLGLRKTRKGGRTSRKSGADYSAPDVQQMQQRLTAA